MKLLDHLTMFNLIVCDTQQYLALFKFIALF